MTKLKKVLLVIVSLAALTGLGAFAYSTLDIQAVSKSFAFYKKELLKQDRDEITKKIQELDDKYGFAPTGAVSK